MLLRDAAQRRTQRMSGNVLHPAVLYEERQVPVAVGIPDPAVAVAGPLEPERPRRFERRAGAPLHFGPAGVEPVATRTSVGEGKRVTVRLALGGRAIIKKK